MIYLKLFWEFLKIGAFTFGGAYGSIPLIRQAVLTNGWMDDERFSTVLAISESTPGPIMVNTATFVGNENAGVLGAIIATFGVVLPSFVIIVLISTILKNVMEKTVVKNALTGMKMCISGVILATGIYMLGTLIITPVSDAIISLSSVVIAIVLGAIIIAYRIFRKKKFSPILLICIAAVLGLILI